MTNDEQNKVTGGEHVTENYNVHHPREVSFIQKTPNIIIREHRIHW